MKILKVISVACVASIMCSTTVFAGEWFKDGNKWAYRNDNGEQIKEGWFTDVDGKVYNFNGGVVRSGFYSEDGKWYYFNPLSGERMSGFIHDSNKTYFTNKAGVMQTGWQYINGSFYYCEGNGVMVTGTHDIGGSKYYFHGDGKLAKDEWVEDETSYVQSDGKLATSTYKDGEYINNRGKVSDSDSTKKVKIDNKTLTLEEYKSYATDAVGRWASDVETLTDSIREYREDYNEEHVYNYEGDDDEYIDKNELPEFIVDEKLSFAASIRAAELASQQRASGARPDGRKAETVLDDAGVAYNRVAESVAFGQNDADECYEDLKDSGTHTSYWRSNQYTRLGAGKAYDADGKVYWVVIYVEV